MCWRSTLHSLRIGCSCLRKGGYALRFALYLACPALLPSIRLVLQQTLRIPTQHRTTRHTIANSIAFHSIPLIPFIILLQLYTGPDCHCTVSNLKPDVDYGFRVCAFNSMGAASAFSEELTPIVLAGKVEAPEHSASTAL